MSFFVGKLGSRDASNPFARSFGLLHNCSPPEARGNRFGKQSFSRLSNSPFPAPLPSVVFSLLCTPPNMEAIPRAKQPVHPPSHGILIFREVAVALFLFSPLPNSLPHFLAIVSRNVSLFVMIWGWHNCLRIFIIIFNDQDLLII